LNDSYRLLGAFVRVLQILNGVAIVTAAALIVVLPTSWSSIAIIACVLAASVILGIAWLLLLAWRKVRVVRARKPLVNGPDLQNLGARIESCFAGLTKRQARFFSTTVLDPGLSTLRISETARPFAGHINIVANISIQLPAYYSNSGLAIPLLFKSRDALTDGLTVTGGDGKRKSTLTQANSIAFEAAACRRLVASAGGRSLLRRYVESIEPSVLIVLGSQRFEASVVIASLGSAIDRMLTGRSQKHRDALIRVFLLVRQLWTAYPILVAIEPPAVGQSVGRDTITRYSVEQDLVLSRKAFNSKGSGPQSWFGRWVSNVKLFLLFLLGLKPADISIPLYNADRCQSYHLQCKLSEERSYLGDQRLEPHGDLDAANVAPIRGQSFSHLHVTEGTGFSDRQFRNWFYEIPPGSSGVAAMVAAAVLFGQCFLAIHQLNWANDGAGFGSATLLLGLPGTVIALFGVGRTAGFLHGSFIGRISTLVSLVTSLMAIAAVALLARNTAHYPALVIDDLRKLPADLIFWIVLLLAQVLNLIVSISAWVYWTYLYWAVKRSYAEKSGDVTNNEVNTRAAPGGWSA
jgi:hypothetical protein